MQVEESCGNDHPGQPAKIDSRIALPPDFHRRHQAFSHHKRVLKFIQSPKPDEITHVQTGMRRLSGRKTLNAVAQRSPPGVGGRIVFATGWIIDQAALLPGEEAPHNGSDAFPSACGGNEEDMRVTRVTQEPPSQTTTDDPRAAQEASPG